MALTLVRLRWALTLNQWRRSTFTLVLAVLGALYVLGLAVFVVVVGAVTLLGGGALAIAGFNWRRSAGEGPSQEDRLLDEQFGDGPVRPYDPDEFRGPGRRDPGARD